MKQLTVKLDYFKASGKWYSSGDFEVNHIIPMYKIWDMVQEKARSGYLPGLGISAEPYSYFISVEVPGHPHNHPHLIIPE